ncbi:MAG: CotH kinase family protein, partial [Verrucomicrobiales bacterium]|nr:CotH kinase family protein [Verrucomicrobiales bacterium]
APPNWPSGSVNGQVFEYGMDPDIVNSGNPAIGGRQRVSDALTALPTLSVVTTQGNLTDASTGIYTHAGSRGRSWERQSSLELIFPPGYVDPDGNTEGFQLDMGLRIRGGFSRSSSNPKHSFRLFFRGVYGEGKLRYPMFGKEGVDEFDNLDLRGPQNYSWAWNGDGNNTFMRDVWSRDLQLELGSPSTRSRYYHLYLNGIYWGVVMTEERPEASFAESYLGGDKDDYDVMKSFGDIADGNRDAYQRLWQRWQTGFTSDANFFRVLGKDPAGNDDPNLEKMVDLQNLMDYMIITYYTGDRDGPGSRYTQPRPNNYFGLYNRENPDGWKFVEHDSEHSMGTGENNMVSPFTRSTSLNEFNPHTLHEGLAANQEYRVMFGDRLQDLMFADGPMNIANGVARLQRRVGQIDTAIIAHSARWGDGGSTLRTRQSWLGAVGGVQSFIEGRPPVLIGQLRAVGWYPPIDAPRFTQHGGYWDSSRALAMSSASGAMYFVRGGGDPRLTGGALSGGAEEFVGSSTGVTIIEGGEEWRYLDDGSDQGTGWKEPGFNDDGWKQGTAPLGYGNGPTTEVLYGPNPDNGDNDGSNKYVTTYFRKQIEIEGADGLDTLRVELMRDDGAVVYVNGAEAMRPNMGGGVITASTLANGVVGGADESTFFSQDIDAGLLVEGTNTVAVEIHQAGRTSSDISFDLKLIGTQVTIGDAVLLDGPGEVTVAARARQGAQW